MPLDRSPLTAAAILGAVLSLVVWLIQTFAWHSWQRNSHFFGNYK
jgi:hypothetical protein